ncbi:MAG: cytochrome c oxidase subunit II [Deltaproteobacteria bacterium]|nr:cytochrome c oxidase subunit II [Deltaproteobacteria bacterium]
MNEFLRRVLFLPEQASTFAKRVDLLHYFVILTTFAAATLIFLTAVWFVVRYRRRRGERTSARFASPPWLEALIVGVPLTLFLVWFGIGYADYVWLRTPPKGAMDVYVMGKQWMWKFAYPGGPNGLDRLVVPEGRPVRLLLTSRDVIHSFFVPAFRIKQDALPGRYSETFFTATRRGSFPAFCAEYCGTAHSMMRAEVLVLAAAEFDAWLASQRRGLQERQDLGQASLSPGSLTEEGRLAAVRHECLKCHSIDGTAHIGPTWRDLYRRPQRLESGQTVVADEGYLTESMMDPLAKVVAGYSPVMPTYQGQLSGPEAAAIVEYIRSLSSAGPPPAMRQEAPGPAYEPIPTQR